MKALIIIDMQMDMQHRLDSGREHVNPEAPGNIAALADTFRTKGLPVIHIRHRDDDPASPMHPGNAGYAPMPCDEAIEDEPVFIKTTSSAFASTHLEHHLRNAAITSLVVTGAVAGFCVNSTVRSGSDLGFDMTVVRDAVLGFDLPEAGISAQAAFDVTMAFLEADFARIVDTSAALAG